MLSHGIHPMADEADVWASEVSIDPALNDGEDLDDTQEVAIFFATETGSSEDVAVTFAQEANARGLIATAQDIGNIDAANLAKMDVALFVTSTTGEGDVPYTAEDFFARIERFSDSELAGLRYAVLALGDSTYDLFCEAGKRLDRALEAAGGKRILERVDCDVDYAGPAERWREDIMSRLAGAATRKAKPPQDIAAVSRKTHKAVAARVIENRVLNGPGSTKATRHIALSFGEQTSYDVGDALGLIVENEDALVSSLIEATGLNGDEVLDRDGEPVALRQVLRETYEITALTPRFIEGWAQITGSPDLNALLSHPDARMAYMHGHQIIDILRAYPADTLDADAFVHLLRPLQPRFYSIASCVEAEPGEVHITVAPVVYEQHGEVRRGVATGQLSTRAPVGTMLSVFVQPNPHFRLPSPEVPIIMIGPGTGIAPFRAFLQQRSLQPDAGPAWLFFGERERHCDFLYEDEIEGFLGAGVLTQLDTAFSRDGAEKIYVQQRLLERAAELADWLEAGAHIYVCGDAAMANDVNDAIIAAIANARDIDARTAGDLLTSMRREKRYQRDVY